ncbi:MAG: HAD family phosphatase [Chloracidobacterium sp.]|uniref:HAD family phosphatase n=1 Tax=Chloracidobacterium validum TaxID=2821543 RepID=A0ABX8BAF3_9BACT|nr:HAD family phosphatase [Chloracidobacterium validum]QUW02040.1 HAD family phosphatase [Chloracidobacterium validum]
MQLTDFAAVIFDMDGLLIDTETIYCQSWQRAAADCGFIITPAFYGQLVGRSRADALRIVLDHFGDRVPMPAFQESVLHYETVCFSEETIPIKPGALELIRAVETRGLPKALATSTHRPAATQRLARTGLDRHFPITITGDDVPRPKPSPDIYLMACEKLGVAPQDALAFEDSDPGVQAAHAAGVTVVMVPDFKAPSPDAHTRAARIFPSLLTALVALGA